VDGLIKLRGLNIPDEFLWEKAGYSPQDITRIKELQAEQPPSALSLAVRRLLPRLRRLALRLPVRRLRQLRPRPPARSASSSPRG
jgi:hypothetical protein